MKNYFRKEVTSLIFLGLILLVSCSDGGGGSDDVPEPPPQSETPPAKAIGTLPANGEPCSDYEEVVADDSKVLVLFNWNAAQFAESYLLTILEGNSQVFNNSFTTLSASVELDRGKTYTWSVTSVNEDGQTNGDSYSFTTPGVPIGNFAPYTAEITVTFDESTFEMNISWVGNDEDGDPLTYDVKVFEEGIPIFESLDLTVSEIAPLAFISNTDYSIEVLSRDSSGNFSVSVLEVSSPN